MIGNKLSFFFLHIIRLEDIINLREDKRKETNAFLAEMRYGKPSEQHVKSEGIKLNKYLCQQNEERKVEKQSFSF